LLGTLALLASACKATDATIPSPCAAECVAPPPSGRWLNGYYVGYQRAAYPEQTIDFSVLTHISVGRIRPLPNGSLATDFDIDPVSGPEMARNVSRLAHQAGRKAILMLGGDGEHAGFVGAASPANRATFVQNLIRVMTDYGYDGIDVDWEPMDPADEAPLLALLKELRGARPNMIITLPIGYVNSNTPTVGPWYATAAPVVDQMNMMTYEMAGNWPGWVSWHTSALEDAQPDHPTSIASSAAAYLAAGVPKAKLGIGIPFYGACWRGVAAPRQALGPNAGIFFSDNTMAYSHIVARYYDPASRHWDAAASAPYLSFGVAKGPESCTFVSYDDEQSITAKGGWVKANGLGGAIIWTINQGHVLTAPSGQQDPLLKAAYQALIP
jgi:chitinase